MLNFTNNIIEHEPGTHIIDDSVISGAMNHIINNQQLSGKIPVRGHVHRLGLLVSVSFLCLLFYIHNHDNYCRDHHLDQLLTLHLLWYLSRSLLLHSKTQQFHIR